MFNSYNNYKDISKEDEGKVNSWGKSSLLIVISNILKHSKLFFDYKLTIDFKAPPLIICNFYC